MALTATDWTVSVQDKASPGGTKKKHHRCKLTLATAGSYPSNGIPIPAASALGMVSRVDYVVPFDSYAAAASYVVKYDQANKTMRVYTTTASTGTALTEVATTVTVGAGGAFIMYVDAVGW